MLHSSRNRPSTTPLLGQAQERAHQRVFVLLLFLFSFLWRLPRRLLLTAPPAALGDDDVPRRRVSFDRVARWRAMLLDWRATYTELGTLAMAAAVVEGTWQLGAHGFSRALHLTLALGVGRGTALAVLGLIVCTQALSCVTLLLPVLYNRSGSVVPSAALVSTLWFEALVFGDLRDRTAQGRCACLTATAFMLALFRFDRQARNARDQLPTSGAFLSIEAMVRSLCTQARTGLLLPPAALGLFVWATGWNAFWRSHGAKYEWERARCQAGLSAAALCLLLSGQDTAAHVVIGDRLERVYDWLMCKKESLLGEGVEARQRRHLGAKKTL